MEKDTPGSDQVDSIRSNPEKRLIKKKGLRSRIEDAEGEKGLIYQLKLHQIELENQNENLRQAQMELENARNKYLDLYEFSPLGYFTIDEKGKIIDVNLTGTALLGMKREDLVKIRFQRLIEKGAIVEFNAFLKRLLEINIKQKCEIKLLKQEGALIYALVEGIVVQRDNKGTKQIRINVIDITEQKRIEEYLRENQYFLSETQRIAHIGSWSYNLITGKLYWSDETYRIFDVQRGRFLPTVDSFLEFVHPDDRANVRKWFNTGCREKMCQGMQFRIALPDNNIRFVFSYCETVFDDSGRPVQMMGTIQDISERKRIEEDLEKIHKLETVGILAGGVAHDFNNLLTAILGNISISKMYLHSDDKIYSRLTNAENACHQAKELSYRLLTFAKGGEPLKRVSSIGKILKETVMNSLSHTDIIAEFSIPDDLHMVEIDEGQMKQVFSNIAINAREAMTGGGSLRLRAKNIIIKEDDQLPLKEGSYIKISIEDSGRGIPEENLIKVFDPYFTTKEMGNVKGTGLGLAICYSIINKHNGFITVESKVGVGTTLHIYLPAYAEHIAEKEKPLTSKGRVLVMDDEPFIRDVAGYILKHVGYEVECVRDGDEAVERYRNAKKTGAPFDVVILDLTVPGGMGGDLAIKRLLKIDPDVRGIVSSGYAKNTIMTDYRTYGFVGTLVKPYSFNQLSEAVIKAMMTGVSEGEDKGC